MIKRVWSFIILGIIFLTIAFLYEFFGVSKVNANNIINTKQMKGWTLTVDLNSSKTYISDSRGKVVGHIEVNNKGEVQFYNYRK